MEEYTQNQTSKSYQANPQYLFSNFVVGASNEKAIKIAKAVAADPGNEIHNPLYIYGQSGVGKTHLLCAIANEIYTTKPDTNIYYAQADTFTSELIWGLQHGTHDEFKRRYRSVDVLIVDDLQFLSGKVATQEEFCSILDFLYHNNKQLILSANNSLSSIVGLENLFDNKFERGVVLCIDKPDIKIRQAIVAQLNDAYNLEINSNAMQYIAETIPDSIRKIIGAMKRLRASRDFDGITLTLDQIKAIICEL